MAEKPILITPEGKKIMTLSAAKAYYESKRNPSKKGAKTFTQFIKEMKSKNKSKLPKLPKLPNKPRKLPKGPKTPSRKMYTPEQLKQLKKIHQNAIKKKKSK